MGRQGCNALTNSAPSLWLKPLDLELRDGGEVPGVTREQRELVFEGGRDDQRIRELQAIGERMRIDKRHGPFRDRRCEGDNLCLLNGEPALGALQFVLTAATLGKFQISNH